MNQIKGNIIGIRDEYSVVINRGSKHGVKEGDKFVIYDEGEEIIDLNGESLGKLEIVKGKVEVDHVSENFSICSSYRKTRIQLTPSIFDSLDSTFGSTKLELLPLNVNKNEINSNLDLKPTKIKIGDLVKQELD